VLVNRSHWTTLCEILDVAPEYSAVQLIIAAKALQQRIAILDAREEAIVAARRGDLNEVLRKFDEAIVLAPVGTDQ
jgi:hypothetical protein